MSFRFINLPAWILMCVFLSVYLVYIGIKRRKADKKLLISTYFIVATIGILAVLYRIFDEVFIQLKHYTEYIFYAIILMLAVTFFQIVYLCITHKGNQRSRRLINIAFLIVLISTIPIVVLIILDLLGTI